MLLNLSDCLFRSRHFRNLAPEFRFGAVHGIWAGGAGAVMGSWGFRAFGVLGRPGIQGPAGTKELS